MCQIIDGKRISQEIKDELKEQMGKRRERGEGRCLAVIQVGKDPASTVYVNNKKKACEYIGIKSLSYELPEEATEQELLSIVEELNGRDDVDGILVQLPLPEHMNEDKVLLAIAPEKDVDGFHPINVGNLSIGRPGYVSCTPAGIIQLLKRSGIEIEGKECVVLGRSNIVGKPMSIMLTQKNATVTLCHSHTEDLAGITSRADILISAVGKAGFVTANMVKQDAIVIDVGINRNREGKLVGDVCFDDVVRKADAITPVPGGVGIMTVTSLLENTLKAAELAVGKR